MKVPWALGVLAVAGLCAYGRKDPVDYANYLRNNKAAAIVADSILGFATPIFTGYSTINDAVPTPILVNCHYGATYLGPEDMSKDAKKYKDAIEYIAADGYQPVTVQQPRGYYNQSWGLGLVWTGGCMIEDHRPNCNFTFNALSRASGLTQMTRVPKDGSVKFSSCGVNMDGAVTTSKTCFQDDSTTVVNLQGNFDEDTISKFFFTATFEESSDDGPKGTYSLQFPCQFALNSILDFSPAGNVAGVDPRVTAFLPNSDSGLFGPKGNGGNIGRRLLKA